MFRMTLYGTDQYVRLQWAGENVIGWDSVGFEQASKTDFYSTVSIWRNMLERACVGQTFSIVHDE